MTSEIEALGGQFLSSSSRETIMYQSTTYTHSLPSVLSILSDTVLNPLITSEELDAQRDAALWEIGEIKNKPEMILPEILHEVAFQGNTLGNPLLCPEERLETMTPETIREFLGSWYKPERMVVAAAGVEHEQLVELAEQYFGEMKSQISTTTSSTSSSTSSSRTSPPLSKNLSTSAPSSASHLNINAAPIPPSETFEVLSTAPAVYTGGELYLEKPELEFTHIYVGYEGLSIHDEDIYALATLQVLLGGGGSFSAGEWCLFRSSPRLLISTSPRRSSRRTGQGHVLAPLHPRPQSTPRCRLLRLLPPLLPRLWPLRPEHCCSPDVPRSNAMVGRQPVGFDYEECEGWDGRD
jgi:mitochondrial-processing peptidase subunit alpha